MGQGRLRVLCCERGTETQGASRVPGHRPTVAMETSGILSGSACVEVGQKGHRGMVLGDKITSMVGCWFPGGDIGYNVSNFKLKLCVFYMCDPSQEKPLGRTGQSPAGGQQPLGHPGRHTCRAYVQGLRVPRRLRVSLPPPGRGAGLRGALGVRLQILEQTLSIVFLEPRGVGGHRMLRSVRLVPLG